jgi:hypothetical protein
MTGKNQLTTKCGMLLAALLAAVLLVSCGSPTPVIEPTVDQQSTIVAVQTQAAQTVVAQITISAPTATDVPTETPVIPTETPAPTNTPEPTLEPTVAATATRVVVTLAPTITFTPTQAALQCSVAEQSPASGAQFAKDADFDAKWKLKNTGTKMWQRENVDLKYVSGTKMQKYADIFDLEENVNPDGHVTFIVDMIAPNTTGRHTTTWALVDGSTTICTFSININVQ